MSEQILTRISIPPALLDEMMTKEAGAFDVPNNKDGLDFMQWWEKASRDDRHAVVKIAHENNVPIVAAKQLFDEKNDE